VKPTKNQKRTCQIPFELNSKSNYFCIQNPLLYQCDTGNNIFDECDRGYIFMIEFHIIIHHLFLLILGYFSRFRPAATTGTFNAGFTWLNSIDLRAPGEYEISFYSFFFCPKTACDTDDTIILSVRDEDSNFREIYRSGVTTGRVRDKEWVREAVLFTASTSKINVFRMFNYFIYYVN